MLSDKLPKTKPLTKIVATIGPSTWDDEILSRMIDSGMTVARINASFADHDELKRVSKQIKRLNSSVALMIDTQGHKIRINKFRGERFLKRGDELEIGILPNVGDVWVDYPGFASDIDPGDRVLMDDGNIKLKLKEITERVVKCEVVEGGQLLPAKTINLPDTHLSFPPLTDKDESDLEYAVEHGFEFVAASFIRDINDVAAIKKITDGSDIKIIAKIENPEGIHNFDSILREVHGIMVARGDLGVEMQAEKVPMLQKQMIEKCRAAGKPVIVATQMMESMRENSRPTRAEISDVANAVLDGADAVMLSAETSTGKYPAEAVDWMAKVCKETESNYQTQIVSGHTVASVETDAVAKYVVELCNELPVKKIVVGTRSGATALSISRHRPKQEIVAFVASEILQGQLNLSRSVRPVLVRTELPSDRDWLVRAMMEYGVNSKLLKPEDLVVLVSGSGVAGKNSNTIVEVARVFQVRDI